MDVLDGNKALEAFIFEKQALGRSVSTIKQFREAYRSFANYLNETGTPEVPAIWTRDTVLGWYVWMERNRNWSQTSRAIWSRALHSFLAHAKQRGWVHFDLPPAVPTVRKERPALNVPQLKLILKAVEHTRYAERNKALIETMLATGLRPGEVAGLQVSDIDWNAGLIRVRPETSKVRTPRAVPLGRALTTVYEYVHFVRGKSRHQGLFLSERGEPMDLRAIQILLQRIGKAAGLSKLSPKMFRHTYATQAALAGMPMPMVQAAMGHSSINTTQIYFNQSMMQHAVGAQQWTPLDIVR